MDAFWQTTWQRKFVEHLAGIRTVVMVADGQKSSDGTSNGQFKIWCTCDSQTWMQFKPKKYDIYIFWSHSINNVIKSFEVSFICGIKVYMFCESHSIQGSFVQAKYFRFYDFFTIRGGHLMLAFRVMVICWPCPDGHYEYFRMSGLDLFVGSVCWMGDWGISMGKQKILQHFIFDYSKLIM